MKINNSLIKVFACIQIQKSKNMFLLFNTSKKKKKKKKRKLIAKILRKSLEDFSIFKIQIRKTKIWH